MIWTKPIHKNRPAINWLQEEIPHIAFPPGTAALVEAARNNKEPLQRGLYLVRRDADDADAKVSGLLGRMADFADTADFLMGFLAPTLLRENPYLPGDDARVRSILFETDVLLVDGIEQLVFSDMDQVDRLIAGRAIGRNKITMVCGNKEDLERLVRSQRMYKHNLHMVR